MPMAKTNDVETYYERSGDGHPLVCVHGGWVDHRMWKPQVEALSDEYEVITYDVRGHGRTGPSTDRRYSTELFAADLKALVDELGLERPSVCGLSLGGMIAQTYAVRYPRDVSALVLADTIASMTLTLRDKVVTALFPSSALRGAVRVLGPERYVDFAFWLAEATRGEDWLGRDDAVRAYVRDTMSSFEATEFNKVFRAGYEFRGVDLSSIRVPTLVLTGERESRAIVKHAAYLQRTIPDARSAVVPDAGHVSNMENPDAFTRELTDFLASVRERDVSEGS